MRIPDHLRPPLIEQLEDQADSDDCLVMRGSALGHALLGNNEERDFFIKKFIEADCKLLTSKQLANVLSVSDAALRKQRSNKRSIFAYTKIRNRIYYPADLIVKKLHENVIVDRS